MEHTTRTRTSRYEVAVPTFTREIGKNAVSPQLISTVLLIVAGWLIYWFSSSDAFYIRHLQVTGNSRVPEAELRAMSGLAGTNIFWVDTDAAEHAIAALPDVKSVQVHCTLPAKCAIELRERPALFVWRRGDAQVWIGGDGMVLPARGDLPNAVILNAVGSTALRPGDRLDPQLVAALQELVQLQPDVPTYQYSDQHGLSFQSQAGWRVRIGDGQDIRKKLNLVQSLTDYLSTQGQTPAFVDVRYPDAPYYGE